MKIYTLTILHLHLPTSPPSPTSENPNPDSNSNSNSNSNSHSLVLSSASDLSSFSFYQRHAVGEFMQFFAQTVVERTLVGDGERVRVSVREDGYVAHVLSRGGGSQLVAVAITDEEYPLRPAYTLLTHLLASFTSQIPSSSSSSSPLANPFSISSTSFSLTKEYLAAYQNPREIDPIMRVQEELDETKIVVHKAIQSVLKRGEDLEKMVEQTAVLSESSKSFYRIAKTQNSCCVVM